MAPTQTILIHAAKAPFKAQAVVEGFRLGSVSKLLCATQHPTKWADVVEKLTFKYNEP